MSQRPLRIVAIVAAHNEADIIEQTTRDLVEQGIQVYLLDDGSSDGTPDVVEPWVGRGVIAIERLASPSEAQARFRLREILARKETLAASLDADWIINHDADELREAPWPDMGLAQGIALVDQLGFNAIDFEVLNFWPTHDDYRAGDDLREAFHYWAPAPEVDRVQIRCWQRQPSVDLVSTGGHEARFEGRRIFPVRFLLRHYPFRSQAHGERKVFRERLPRFSEEERASGWHVQYDQMAPGQRFVRDPLTMVRYDAPSVRVRLSQEHRGVDAVALEQLQIVHDAAMQELKRQLTAMSTERERLTRALSDAEATAVRRASAIERLTAERTASAEKIEEFTRQLTEAQRHLTESRQQTADLDRELSNVRQALADEAARASALLASRTWRWTAAARMMASKIGIK